MSQWGKIYREIEICCINPINTILFASSSHKNRLLDKTMELDQLFPLTKVKKIKNLVSTF